MESPPTSPASSGEPQSGPGLKALETIAVLVSGVVGGLILVISVMLFCKYCIKRKRHLRRQPAFVEHGTTDRPSRRLHNHPQVYLHSEGRYESLTPTNHASPPDEGKPPHHPSLKSKRKIHHRRGEGTPTDEENDIDSAVARYKESLQGPEEPPDTEQKPSHDMDKDRPRKGRDSVTSLVTSPTGERTASPPGLLAATERRRVSFQLSEKAATFTTATLLARERERDRRPSYGRPGRERVVKQQSVGGLYLSLDGYPRGMDEAGLVHDDVVTETTPMLSPLVRDEFPLNSSPAPILKPYHTEVTVEVHRDPSINGDITLPPSEIILPAITKGRGASPVQGAAPSPYGPNMSTLSVPSQRRASASHRRGSETRQAHSLEIITPVEKRRVSLALERKVRSYEDRTYSTPRSEYDRFEITEFSMGPFYSTDDLVPEDENNPTPQLRSKVRYNDTGSLEDVNEEHLDLIDDIGNVSESDETDTLNGTQKYRELWNLRATFEEEEDFSDTIRMEDITSPDEQSTEEKEVTTSLTTSFESNTEAVVEVDSASTGRSEHQSSDETVIRNAACNLVLPRDNKRQTYRSILTKRLRRSGDPPMSADNSFDSVDTIETDGETDTSRHEVTTTAFESTTDNTDSTGETATHKLQQMRGDSGYKSLETQQSRDVQSVSKPPRKQIQFVLDHDSVQRGDLGRGGANAVGKRGAQGRSQSLDSTVPVKRNSRGRSSLFERRNGKTASRKRREYRTERQIIRVYESINEPETDSKSDQPSGDSLDDGLKRDDSISIVSGAGPRKFSLFSRFAKSHSKEAAAKRSLSRDFSVDEKTDALFNAFVRYDPRMEEEISSGATADPVITSSPRPAEVVIHPRSRLQRKNTEPVLNVMSRRRERMRPDMRSASISECVMPTDRRHSPHGGGSIVEEYNGASRIGVGVSSLNWSSIGGRRLKGTSSAASVGARRHSMDVLTSTAEMAARFASRTAPPQQEGSLDDGHSSAAFQDIPIIRLPEEEASSA